MISCCVKNYYSSEIIFHHQKSRLKKAA
jgi:hypothetical protein